MAGGSCRLLGVLVVLLLAASPRGAEAKPRRKASLKGIEGPVDKDVFERGLVTESVTYKKILKEHGQYYNATSRRNFGGAILAYVTPWNGKGYEVTRKFLGKFTHVSPVWYQLRKTPSEDPQGHQSGIPGGPPTITGGHDVDQGWARDVRGPSAPEGSGRPYVGARVVPRVLLEGWSAPDFIHLMTGKANGRDYFKDDVSDKHAREAAGVIVSECIKQGWDGIVLEGWTQWSYMGLLDHQPLVDAAVNLVAVISQQLREATAPSGLPMQLILAVPPAQPTGGGPHFSAEHWRALAPHVDLLSAMTYDHSSPHSPGPNAPAPWIEANIRVVVGAGAPAKVLAGLNFYGNDFTLPQGGGAIVGHEYRGVLERAKPKEVVWDAESAEHFFDYDGDVGRRRVYFPTLASIQRRLDIARELGTGVAIWEVGQGLDYWYDLL